jgi:hypothetical protein
VTVNFRREIRFSNVKSASVMLFGIIGVPASFVDQHRVSWISPTVLCVSRRCFGGRFGGPSDVLVAQAPAVCRRSTTSRPLRHDRGLNALNAQNGQRKGNDHVDHDHLQL